MAWADDYCEFWEASLKVVKAELVSSGLSRMCFKMEDPFPKKNFLVKNLVEFVRHWKWL